MRNANIGTPEEEIIVVPVREPAKQPVRAPA
jgi:hypothetical protein